MIHNIRYKQRKCKNYIVIIPKQANPPKVPKAGPIEDFWSMLADKVYEGGWQAKSALQLERRIYQKIKQIDINILEHMMIIRTKLRKVENKGPFSIL